MKNLFIKGLLLLGVCLSLIVHFGIVVFAEETKENGIMTGEENYDELIGYMQAKDYHAAIRYICGQMQKDYENNPDNVLSIITGTWNSEGSTDVLVINSDGSCFINENECIWELAAWGPNDYGVFGIEIYPEIYEGKEGMYEFIYLPENGVLQFNSVTAGMSVEIFEGNYKKEE